MKYEFHSGEDLCRICKEYGISIGEVMLLNEIEAADSDRDSVMNEMRENLKVMRDSIEKGLDESYPPRGKLLGADAVKIRAFADKANMGKDMAQIVSSAMAVAENNAAMGKIVAAPTAGASGILPAILISCGGRMHGFDDDRLCMGLFTAGAIGCIIAENASIAGASGGCQAEIGTGAAMGAAALIELCGGSPEQATNAAAIALKNCMGLVCDPVAGLVECPCIKRNAIGATNAVLSSDLSLAGIESLIPFDEVVFAMKSVGESMCGDLKETARGGIAASETAVKLSQKVTGKQ